MDVEIASQNTRHLLLYLSFVHSSIQSFISPSFDPRIIVFRYSVAPCSTHLLKLMAIEDELQLLFTSNSCG